MREAMMVFCLRCGGYYDMDHEEGWDDHHTTPDGRDCAPATGCHWATDVTGRYCIADHPPVDWKVVVVPQDADT